MIQESVLTRAYQYGLATHGRRIVRFGLVGGIGVVVNTALLYLLVSHAGWNHLWAAAVATEAAILCNFALNDRWTFRDARARTHALGRLFRYNAIALGGLGITLIVMAVLTLGLHMHYLLANLVAIAAATVWNYVVNSRLTWAFQAAGDERLPAGYRPVAEFATEER